ncbi:hypothetical protein [Achromobacter marplatensis]|jgi:hypothetical protein|uniref:hypothetical protein n=1 Tax=Achromobacter marplatensis TaxID=470868 RepID=UPI0002781295|nr:hypothetical protein [Achromobacter marplatensis]EJO28282.1 hypothetical protein QWC_27626 [Achromobacter marplatensis]
MIAFTRPPPPFPGSLFTDMSPPMLTLWFRRFWLLAITSLITLHAGASFAQTFDRQAENQRYQQWLQDFRRDFQQFRQTPDRENADVDKLFANTLVPGSRASQVVKELARAQGDTTHGEIRFVGIQRVFMAALSNSVVAGDGGVYPETQAAFKQQTLRVRYMHVDGGGRLENYFNNPEIFKPYRLPDPGVLTRDAYPFLLFEDAQGKLRLGGVSKEFWDLVKYMDAQQYA